MEDTLGEGSKEDLKKVFKGLNPCSNGRYSRRSSIYGNFDKVVAVLILVLMEDTLGGLGA